MKNGECCGGSEVLDIENMTLSQLQLELQSLMKAVTVINHLAVSLDINAALESVRDVTLELLDCDRVTLFLVFDRHKELRAKGHDSSGESFVIRVKFGEGIAGTVAQTGDCMNVADAYENPLFNPLVDKCTGYQTHSLLCCAICDMSGRNVAVLQALNKRGKRAFSCADERNLKLFGTHLGNTLAKAKLHEQAEREKHRLSALFNYFKLLSTAGNLGQVLQMVTDSLHEVLHAEHAFVFIMDAPRSELWMQCSVPSEQGSGEILSVRVRVGEGLVGRCGLDHSEPINISDFTGDDELLTSVLRPVLGASPVHSVLVQPIFGNDHSGKVAAVILAVNKVDWSRSGTSCEAEQDIFFEDYFTVSDMDAMALFALEVGDTLAARSLEVAYASALSVVNSDGTAHSRTCHAHVGDTCSSKPGSTEERSSWQLRSQLMNMYFRGPDEYSLHGGDGSPAASSTHHPTRSSGMPKSLGHWQSALNKLTAVRIVADSQRAKERLRTRLYPQQYKRTGSNSGTTCGLQHRSSSTGAATLLGTWSGTLHSHSYRDILRQELGGNSGEVRPHSFTYEAYTDPPMHWALDHGNSHGMRPASFTAGILSSAPGWSGLWHDDGDVETIQETAEAEEAAPDRATAPAAAAAGRATAVAADGQLPHCGSDPAAPIGRSQRADDMLDASTLSVPLSRLKVRRASQPQISAKSDTKRSSGLSLQTSEAALAPAGPADQSSRSAPALSPVTWHRSTASSLNPLQAANSGSSASSMCFLGEALLASWDYNFTEAGPDTMNKICYDIFLLSGVVEHFNLNLTTLGNLLAAVASHYHDIPYHNFNHVCHVLHSTWMMLQTPTAMGILSMEDRLGLLLAALCHDLDHDGRSNSYHMHTESELARLYNDCSVMENHHCALAFEILRRKDCALLDDLDKDVRRRLRKMIICAIQCTDMSNHFNMTQDFRNHVLEFDPNSDADRQLLGKVILHAADIGNAVRPFQVNDVMSKRVHREFELLAAEEQRLGIPITFSIDSTNQLLCAQMEVNFLDYIVVPLWERLAEVLPEMQPALDNLLRNREQYARAAEAAGIQAADEEAAAGS